MDFFVQQLVNGLTLGSLYALLALGYSIVYGVLGLLNFAQGEVYMVGAFIGFGVLSGLGGPTALVMPVPHHASRCRSCSQERLRTATGEAGTSGAEGRWSRRTACADARR